MKREHHYRNTTELCILHSEQEVKIYCIQSVYTSQKDMGCRNMATKPSLT